MCAGSAVWYLLLPSKPNMDLTAFIKDILFVIVLYKKKPEECPVFDGVTRLSNELLMDLSVFVYDNSPEPSLINDKLIYKHDPANSGVAKAYNEAFLEANKLAKKWMMLLDQDTHFETSFIESLPAAIQKYPETVAFVPKLSDEFSLVSPFRWHMGRGKRIAAFKAKLDLKEFRFLNSGLLISADAFKNVNGYDETIPLYFSDIAFGEKLMKITDHFVVIDVRLRHSFSASEKISKRAALHRYRYFCLGAFAMGHKFGSYPLYYFRALLRGLNLSMRYKTVSFLKTFLEI